MAASNTVYFGAMQALITAASVTNLTVTVPAGATYAPITVTVNGLTAYADQPFMPMFSGIGQIDSSSLGPQLVLPAGSGPNQVVIADLDGDGKPDLIVAYDYGNTISIYRNISTNGPLTAASFAPPVNLATPSGIYTPFALVVADLDGDGKLDIIASDHGANLVSIYRNISTPGSISSNSFATRVDFATGSSPQGVAVADLDGDGRPDLLVANSGDGTVSILRNTGTDGNIVFAPKVDIATGSGCGGVAAGDLDGDGKPDVVTANGGTGTVSLLQNISTPGNIAFAAKVDLAVLNEPVWVAIGDLDGDGKPDLTVTFYLPDTDVAVFRNTSTIGGLTTNSFAPGIYFPLGGRGHTPAIADLDGDGKPDLAVVTELNSLLSIFKNVSTPGSFTNSSLAGHVDFPTGYNAWGVAIGDLDGDGRPDIIFANTYDNTISIYQNQVPFAKPPVITTATATATLAGVFVVGANISNSGSGYTNTPAVRIIGGGGSGATAVAVVSNGMVVTINITGAGSGYTNAPVIVIDPPFVPNPVLGIAPMSFLTFSNVTIGGNYQLQQFQSYYWTNQSASFMASNTIYTQMVSGVAGNGDYRLAQAPAPIQAFATPQVVNGFVVGATVTAGGSGYVATPAVNIVADVGTNAMAVAGINGGVVTGISIINAGIGYTNQVAIQIDPPPAAAVYSSSVQPVMRLDSANLAPYENYQIQFEPAITGVWGNWIGSLFNPTTVTNSQYLFITNYTGFFRLQYLPPP